MYNSLVVAGGVGFLVLLLFLRRSSQGTAPETPAPGPLQGEYQPLDQTPSQGALLGPLQGEYQPLDQTPLAGPMDRYTNTPIISVQGAALTLNDLYIKYGQIYGLDWRLLKAVAIVESSENPDAINPKDPSWGLMQVLCVQGGEGPVTTNLPAVRRGWPPAYCSELLDPDYCVSIAAQILKWNIDTYGLERGVAVYNNYSSRSGDIKNPDYVRKVFDAYNRIQATSTRSANFI